MEMVGLLAFTTVNNLILGFSGGSVVKNVCAMQVQSLGREDPLEKRTTTRSIIFVRGIPWTEECGNLLSMESQRVGHN